MKWPFESSRRRAQSVILVDIGAGAVAGGYAYVAGASPTLAYSARVSIEAHAGEAAAAAMARALAELGNLLIREGAPELARLAGDARAESVLVAVNAPWQKTSIRTERFENMRPFIFTERMAVEAVERAGAPPSGMMPVDESVIATLLNGYETRRPYGKRAHRASIIILSSFIDTEIAERAGKALHALFHGRAVRSIAGSSLRYQTLSRIFAHERDAIILDARGPEIAVSLVRDGLLVAVSELQSGAPGAPGWMHEVVSAFADLAKRYPLPHTIFLIADPADFDALKHLFADVKLGALWLSDNPPKVVPVLPAHLPGVTLAPGATNELVLMLMTLFWRQHRVACA